MSEIKKEIDLSGLPRRGKNINWKNSIGCKCKFIYEDTKGEVEIIGYDKNEIKRNIIFKYGSKTFKMFTGDFTKCGFGRVLGKITDEFKIKIGKAFKDDKRDFIIIDRKHVKESGEYNLNKKFYKYKCNICGYEDGWCEERYLLGGYGCSCCASRTVVPGINDIATTDPWMIPYLVNKEDAYKYTHCSNNKIVVKCPDCGRVKYKHVKISDIYRNHSIGCPCSDKISYPEKLMFNILEQLGVDFEWQLSKSTFDWCGEYKYDFYDKNLNMIIETHGAQHYKENTNFKMKLEDVIQNDSDKRELAFNNGINKYIIIDGSESNLEYIKKAIIHSELSNIYDLSQINWDVVDSFALDNLVKKICEYYELNKDKILIQYIAKKFKLDRNTITRYLKLGNKFNWCDYDKNYARNVRNRIYKPHNCKKVFVLELNKEFMSVADCGKYMSVKYNEKFNNPTIAYVCRTGTNYYKGFHFKYV